MEGKKKPTVHIFSAFKKSYPLESQVAQAEIKIIGFIAMPMALAGHLGHLFKDVIHDSIIGKHYACGKTKENGIFKRANMPGLPKYLVERMRQNCFSISKHGSNDQRLTKMNPVKVPLFDFNQQKVVAQSLDMCLSTASIAKGIFNSIDDASVKNKFPWEKCISLGVNSTSVNICKHNSFETRVGIEQQYYLDGMSMSHGSQCCTTSSKIV